MRKREEIQKDGTRVDILILEVLLDIRDLLTKQPLDAIKKKRGRPRKIK